MLTQGEMNFYGFNPNNIICRENRGRVSVVLKYDAANKFFVVTRRTLNAFWEDRYRNLENAKKRYLEFLHFSNKKLEEMLVGGAVRC